MAYEAVIGLEVHAQLRTRSKMFCGCATRFEAGPNTQVCPVCLGHPGVLPVVNRHAVELAVRVGLAAGATVHRYSTWARKNYFYPDLPKGYQITQYEEPLVRGGGIEIDTEGGARRIGIERMHLEEDAGRSRHPEWVGETRTLIDLNRCGVPLLEIVSEPSIRTPSEGVDYLAKLKQLLQYLDACDGDMEKGSLRCDANLSVRIAGEDRLGTKTELKNLNSFRHVERALSFEFERQVGLMEAGGEVAAATLLWDAERGEARVMRSKEEAHDYRYFPEPDLPPLVLDEAWIDEIRSGLPELPAVRRERLVTAYGIRRYDAALLAAERGLADYFEAVAAEVPDPQAAANFISTELLGLLRNGRQEIAQSPVAPGALAQLLRLVAQGTLSSKLAKQILPEMARTQRGAEEIARERGWVQVDDAQQLRAWVREVLEAHPAEVAAYAAGRAGLLQFFMGEVMRHSQGRAHPRRAQAMLREALGERTP